MHLMLACVILLAMPCGCKALPCRGARGKAQPMESQKTRLQSCHGHLSSISTRSSAQLGPPGGGYSPCTRVSALTKQNPSTWYSSAQCFRESMMSVRTTAWPQLSTPLLR